MKRETHVIKSHPT